MISGITFLGYDKKGLECRCGLEIGPCKVRAGDRKEIGKTLYVVSSTRSDISLVNLGKYELYNLITSLIYWITLRAKVSDKFIFLSPVKI